MDNLHWDAEAVLNRYIYDYMVRKNFHFSARTFKDEANLPNGQAAINDSPCGFLLEWWLIFWDTYIARQSKIGAQQACNELSSFLSYNQEHYNSQFMETGASSKEPWPGTQLLQPAMMSQRAASLNLSDNIYVHNSAIRHNQQTKPEYHSANAFIALNENWIKQSNFFTCQKQNAQPLSIGSMSSNLAFHLNADIHSAEMQVPQIMNLGHLRSDGSLPLTLKTTTAELEMPTFGVLHAAKGVNLNAEKNKLRIGPGIDSTNIEYKGPNQWVSPREQWDEILMLTNQQKQYQFHQYPVQGFNTPSSGSHLQSIYSYDHFPSFLQIDKQKFAENEDQRKRKEPSNSGSKNILRNTADGGPSKLPYFTVASPLKGGLASHTVSRSCREVELPENSKTLDVTSHLKKVSVAKDAAWQSTTDDVNGKAALKDDNVQHHGEIYSSTVQQYSLDGNRDKNDKRKLGPGTTAMEGPVQIDSFMNQQFKQDEGVQPGNSEIHHPAKEMKDENNGTQP